MHHDTIISILINYSLLTHPAHIIIKDRLGRVVQREIVVTEVGVIVRVPHQAMMTEGRHGQVHTIDSFPLGLERSQLLRPTGAGGLVVNVPRAFRP